MLVTGILTVSIWADPSHRWFRQPGALTRVLVPGEAIVSPPNEDERLLKRRLIELQPKADTVVLGSSRAMSFTSPDVDYKLLNLSVSGASVEDYVALWQVLKATDKIPRHVLIAPDPWIFNRNSKQDRWRSLADDYNDFERMHRATTPYAAINAAYYWTYSIFVHRKLGFDEFTDLLSFKTVKASMEFLWLRRADLIDATKEAHNPAYIVESKDFPNNRHGWMWDGSHIYRALDLVPPSEGEAVDRGRKYLEEPIYGLANYGESSEARLLLKSLLQDIKGAGCTVLIVSLPYSPTVYKGMSLRGTYRQILQTYSENLRRTVAESGNGIDIVNMLDPEFADCRDIEFMDGMHALPKCVEKISKIIRTGHVIPI